MEMVECRQIERKWFSPHRGIQRRIRIGHESVVRQARTQIANER
jgi:hypothetical protein